MYRDVKKTKALAKEILKKHYWNVFAFIVVAGIIVIVPVVGLILGGPILAGASYLLLKTINEDDSTKFNLLFKEFNNFERHFKIHLLAILKVFLWGLLFIIPGIIRAYGLSQIYFIAEEHKDLSPSEVLKMSTQMMKGNKGRLLGLQLSFFPWYILSILSFGVLFFFLLPYVQITNVLFHNEILEKNPQFRPKEEQVIWVTKQ